MSGRAITKVCWRSKWGIGSLQVYFSGNNTLLLQLVTDLRVCCVSLCMYLSVYGVAHRLLGLRGKRKHRRYTYPFALTSIPAITPYLYPYSPRSVYATKRIRPLFARLYSWSLTINLNLSTSLCQNVRCCTQLHMKRSGLGIVVYWLYLFVYDIFKYIIHK